jgi:hypothetical protein
LFPEYQISTNRTKWINLKMICYFPYTYIPINRLRILCEFFSRLSVFQPGQKYVSSGMRQLADRQRLDIRVPRKVDSGRLEAALDEFNAWAGMHPEGLDDLKSFFQTHQNRPPFVDETHSTQIRTQIRRFGREGEAHPDQSLHSDLPQLKAALFLSLAHRFDEQQNHLAGELGAVQQMERQMFTRLSGNDPVDAVSPVLSKDSPPMDSLKDSPLSPVDTPRSLRAAGYMVNERIQAWAALAADEPELDRAYITSDRQVAEAILDIFPESIGLARWNLGRLGERPPEEPGYPNDLLKKIEEFAFCEILSVSGTIEIPHAWSITPDDEDVQFFLLGVPRCSPHRALARLMKDGSGGDEIPSPDPSAENTLFGLITGI